MEAKDWIATISAVVAVAALGATYWTYRLTRNHLLLERVHKLTDRLYEIDRLTLEYPGLQEILYLESDRIYRRSDPATHYFVVGRPHDEQYFQVKTFLYTQLNLCDEIVSVVEGDTLLERTFEFAQWKDYMTKRLRHPLFRELIDREGSIWGPKFNRFVESIRAKLLEPFDKELY